jgi:Ran GTPase-activating protein (RanGAP) involved in mRNA processing and transport
LGDQGASIISSALSMENNGTHHHTNLRVLDLGFNDIGDLGAHAIALHAVAGNYTLQKLYLAGNRIETKGAISLGAGILHGTGVKALHLSANRIGSDGLKAISGAIVKNDEKMALLALNTTVTATNTMEDIVSVRGMDELHISSTGIDSKGFLAVPSLLLTTSTLKTLCLSNNNLGDQDIIVMSQALSHNTLVPLQTLRLSYNLITCQGVECLMNAIWGSTTLREIKLDNNKIQDRGAQLCAVVLTSISLSSLDLAFNRITTTGIKALMKNISESDSLQSLSLCGIAIDQNASKAVSYALAYNGSLRAVYMDNCSTGYSSQRHIVAGVVSNRRSSLRVLTGFAIPRKYTVVPHASRVYMRAHTLIASLSLTQQPSR